MQVAVLVGGQGLFCYVNSVFAPGLDEGVGNLWRVGLLFRLFPKDRWRLVADQQM